MYCDTSSVVGRSRHIRLVVPGETERTITNERLLTLIFINNFEIYLFYYLRLFATSHTSHLSFLSIPFPPNTILSLASIMEALFIRLIVADR